VPDQIVISFANNSSAGLAGWASWLSHVSISVRLYPPRVFIVFRFPKRAASPYEKGIKKKTIEWIILYVQLTVVLCMPARKCRVG
jgi:hypothetical protein